MRASSAASSRPAISPSTAPRRRSSSRRAPPSVYLRNSWYVAAWDREVSRRPLARTYLDEPVVLFRKEDGTPVALQDRCCHRYLPLSRGKLEADRLRCGYHGLLFDADGKCVEIPGQANIPPQAKVRAFPTQERVGWIWIWMGDA